MGACFTKTTALPPTPQQLDVKSEVQQAHNTKNDQQVVKKEIFVIKHRISHEIGRDADKDEPDSLNPIATAGDGESRNAGGARVRTSSCSKEEVDAILIQCGRLSRSNSTGAHNPSRKRRYSRSKRSFDFDLSTRLNNDDDDDVDVNDNGDGGLNHQHRHGQRQRQRQQEARVSSSSSRRSSRERDLRLQRSSSKERGSGRRISISPSRRSESPFRNLNAPAVPGGGSSNRPAKMVSVPATDKSNSVGVEQAVVGSVKRIHVKRNVGVASPRAQSPAKTNLRVFTENPSQEQTPPPTDARQDDHLYNRRKSLAEIDNNAAKSSQPGSTKTAVMVPTSVEKLMLRQNITRSRRLSRDLDTKPERTLDPSPPSYASLLLEDIHNFHQKNMNANTPAPPAFSLPACVTKACSIMEAVADLNSSTSSFSDDRWKNPTPISETVVNDELDQSICNYVTVRQGVSAATEEQESMGSNSAREANSTDPITRERDASPFGGCPFPRESMGSNSAREANSTDPITRERDASPFGGCPFPRELVDHPRNGIGRCRRKRTIAST